MKIWILTSKFGNGHFSAANALKEELTTLGHDVQIDDIIQITHPRLYKTIYNVFNNVICRHDTIYNFLNQFGRNPKKDPKPKNNVRKRLNEINPDIIITTWSACARMIGKVDIPLYTCITDIGLHNGWISNNVDYYLVANQKVKDKLLKKGINKRNIIIYGIPVKQEFHDISKTINHKKNVLIMGGGLGIISWLNDILNGYKKDANYSITIIAGNNPKLLKHLQNDYPYIKSIGFTDKIHEYMANADVILSKPGGVSLFESIYAQTPYIAVDPSYEHEIENANFILEKNIGTVLHSSDNLVNEVTDILNNEEELKAYSNNLDKLKTKLILQKSQLFCDTRRKICSAD